jgi:16S rRNA processing protein RimM
MNRNADQPSPSPSRSREGETTIGKVVGAFGLKGTLKIWPDTDFPERFDPGRSLIIEGTPYEILETRWHKLQARVRVRGITKIDQAEAMIGKTVSVPAGDLPELREGEYMVSDLIGLEVFDEGGAKLGVVEDVVKGAAQDLYDVSGVLVPAVKEFIKDVDLQKRRMVIRPIVGMFEDV